MIIKAVNFMEKVDLIAEKIASKAIKLATSGKLSGEFKIKNLFDKETWENFPVGARISVGKKF